MTDNPPVEQVEQPQQLDVRDVFPAPADIDEDRATGWAVYDHQLARFVGGVTADRPDAKARKAAAGDHPTSVVRV